MVNMVWVSWSPWSPLPNSDGGVTVAPHCISARERRVLEHQHAFQRIWVTDTYTKPFAMLSTLFSSSQSSDQVTLYPRNPQYDPQRCLETFKLYGEQYRRKNTIAVMGKTKKKNSPVWAYGEALVRAGDQKEVYYCYLCESERKPQKLPVLCGTKGGIDHMVVHGFDREGNKVEKAPATQRRLTSFATMVSTYDYDKFKRLFLRWIVYCQLAFAMLENDYFRELVAFLNIGLAGLLPRAGVTLRRWIMDEYAEQKEGVKAELRLAKSDIHLSFDMWTAPNGIAILSVFGHWISPSGTRQNKLLAFRRVYSKHTGEHQGEIVISVVREYEFEDRVGYIIGDNISSNDAAAHTILSRLYPGLSLEDRTGRRLRCLGHIVNLCANALIFGGGKKGGDKELDRLANKGDSEGCDELWRGRGPVGRLHNIIKYIRWSPQRRQEFMECIKGGELAEFDLLEVSGRVACLVIYMDARHNGEHGCLIMEKNSNLTRVHVIASISQLHVLHDPHIVGP